MWNWFWRSVSYPKRWSPGSVRSPEKNGNAGRSRSPKRLDVNMQQPSHYARHSTTVDESGMSNEGSASNAGPKKHVCYPALPWDASSRVSPRTSDLLSGSCLLMFQPSIAEHRDSICHEFSVKRHPGFGGDLRRLEGAVEREGTWRTYDVENVRRHRRYRPVRSAITKWHEMARSWRQEK